MLLEKSMLRGAKAPGGRHTLAGSQRRLKWLLLAVWNIEDGCQSIEILDLEPDESREREDLSEEGEVSRAVELRLDLSSSLEAMWRM